MIVVIGGTPGSGKTTVAEIFAKTYGYALVSAGAMFRQMAAAHGADLVGFSHRAEKDHGIDRELDGRVLEEVLRQDTFGSDVIVDGRIQGHLLEARRVPCLKVWIDAPLELRAGRGAGGGGATVGTGGVRAGALQGDLRDRPRGHERPRARDRLVRQGPGGDRRPRVGSGSRMSDLIVLPAPRASQT